MEKFDRRFVWKIKTLSNILRQAKAGRKIFWKVLLSTQIYRAESNGFKSKVQIYPNGELSGQNTQLSVYIFVMKGEYDAILP